MPTASKSLRILRILLLSVVLVGLLLAAAWQWRHPLLAVALESLLQQQGLTGVVVEVDALSLESLQLGRLTVADGDGQWRVAATGVVLGYHPDGLSQGRIDTLTVADAVIEGSAVETIAPTGAEPPAIDLRQIVSLWRGPWRRRIPVGDVRVDRLSLGGAVFGHFDGSVLSLEGRRQANALELRLALLDQPDFPRVLIIDSVSPERVAIDLLSGGRSGRPLAAKIAFADDTLSSAVDVELAGLMQWLHPFNLVPLTDTLNGTLRVDAKVTLSKDGSYPLELGLAAPKLVLGDLAIEGLTARLAAVGESQDGRWSVAIRSGTTLGLTAMRQAALRMGPAQLEVAGSLEQEPQGWRLLIAPDSRIVVSHLESGTSRVDSMTLLLPQSIRYRPGQTELVIGPGSELAVVGLSFDQATVAKLRLTPLSTENRVLSWERDSGWTLSPGQWRIDSGAITRGGAVLRAGKLDLSIERLLLGSQNWQLAVAVSAASLLLQQNGLAVPLRGISARVEAGGDRITVTGHFQPQRVGIPIAFEVTQELESQQGRARLYTRHAADLSGGDDTLSKVLKRWPYDFDLVTGRVALSLAAAWSARRPRVTLNATVNEGGGYVGETVFSGLTLKGGVSLLPALRTKRPVEVAVQTVDVGVLIEQFAARLSLRPGSGGQPLVVVDRVGGTVVGAGFSAERLRYDFNTASGAMELKLKGLDLERLTSLAAVNGITATGTVDGTLPLRMGPDGVRIEQGKLWSRAPGGRLSYIPEGQGAGGASIAAYALKALRDYRYHRLMAGLQYQADGTLLTSLHLEGISPDIDAKRPVHLNINLEQNLLALLHSLRSAGGVSGELDKRVRRHYGNKTKAR